MWKFYSKSLQLQRKWTDRVLAQGQVHGLVICSWALCLEGLMLECSSVIVLIALIIFKQRDPVVAPCYGSHKLCSKSDLLLMKGCGTWLCKMQVWGPGILAQFKKQGSLVESTLYPHCGSVLLTLSSGQVTSPLWVPHSRILEESI